MKLEETAIRAARAVVAHSAKLSFHLVKRSVQFTEDRSFLANFSRAKLSCLSALTMLAVAPAASSRAGELSPAAQLPPAAEQMAKTHGLDSFGQIEGIRYTFNAWEGYKKAGPLLISTEHRGTADGGPFHEFFSDVAVKLTGSDTWINAQ